MVVGWARNREGRKGNEPKRPGGAGLKPKQAKNSDKSAKKSTAVAGELADDYFRQEAKARWQADIDRLTGKKTSVTFKVEVPLPILNIERYRTIMEMAIPATIGGRPLEHETARVIKAEAYRRLANSGLPRECQESMSEMSKHFHIDKPESERYDRYRAIVSTHKGKIKELLSILNK